MNVGDTFLPSGQIGSHLWVVIGINKTGQVAIVNFTTKRPGKDESCVIHAGEHPFVKHETIAEYRKARLLKAQDVEALEQYAGIKQAPVSKSLLKRLQKGALTSDFTPQDIQQAVKESLIS